MRSDHISPNGASTLFPRRGSGAGLEDQDKDREAKERRGILGIRRISLVGAHKRHKSTADESLPSNSPIDSSASQAQTNGFHLSSPDTVRCKVPPCCREPDGFCFRSLHIP
jgi:serine/arginine repetitive matrix protein 2